MPEFLLPSTKEIHLGAILGSNGEIPVNSERFSERLKMRYALNPVYTLYNVHYTWIRGGDNIAKKKEIPFDKTAYDRQYQKDNFTRLVVPLHKEHDADIIQFLDEQENKSGYIKRLIRKDISDPDRD